MKTVAEEFKYKGWDVKITKNDTLPLSQQYEWEVRKDGYEEVLDPTSWSDLKGSEGAAKEVVDFFEEPNNKSFLDRIVVKGVNRKKRY